MSSSIIKLNEQELGKIAGLNYNSNTSSLVAEIGNDKFLKKYSFSSDKIEEANIICEAFANDNIKTLLVEGNSSITVWIEKKTTDSSEIKTKKVKRTYLGQTYEIVVDINSATPKPATNKPKTRRKYRGQYID